MFSGEIRPEVSYSAEGSVMGCPEYPNWFMDCGSIDDFSVAGGDFSAPNTDFLWGSQGLNCSNNVSVESDVSMKNPESTTKMDSRKRPRSESCSRSGSKACREKMRRDMLNERFAELASILEPEKPPKIDKSAILSDVVRVVTQLRSEAEKLKESNENLQEKIKELKAEKNELRDEKQRLKVEKEQLEQQVKAISVVPSFVPHPSAFPPTFAAQGHPAGNKLMPYIGYPGVAMWQFMPPAAVDTSQDHVLHPPVA